ncbi:hypothetical protein ONZ45_g3420 [Pleurotus djamor]|nr:hypothetical protein ONZ45_g3420 [Pleurotus djamor]
MFADFQLFDTSPGTLPYEHPYTLPSLSSRLNVNDGFTEMEEGSPVPTIFPVVHANPETSKRAGIVALAVSALSLVDKHANPYQHLPNRPEPQWQGPLLSKFDVVVSLSGGHKQEWVLDWDWSVFLIVAWATIQFIILFFRRINHSYARVERCIPLWRDVSQSITSFARSVQSDRANVAVQTKALHLLEELVIALQLVNELQHPTVSDKGISVDQPADEDVRSPELDLPNTLRSHLGACFPTIPSDGATVGGITSSVWYTPWKLINIDLLDVVVAMKAKRNDVASVSTAQARLDLLDDISDKLEALKWLRPYYTSFIYYSLLKAIGTFVDWRRVEMRTHYYCSGRPLSEFLASPSMPFNQNVQVSSNDTAYFKGARLHDLIHHGHQTTRGLVLPSHEDLLPIPDDSGNALPPATGIQRT